MKEFPRGGLIGRAVHTFQWLSTLNIPVYAANAGYFIVLSVFPALLLILSSLRYTGFTVDVLLDALEAVLPSPLMGAAETLVFSVYQNSTGTVAGIAAVTALWSSSRGVYGLLTGLNRIYGVAEDRSYFFTRGISVLYTFGLQFVLTLTLMLHVFGSTIIEFLLQIDNPIVMFVLDILNLRFFLLLVLQTILFTLIFVVLPNRHNGFMQSLPGGLLTSIGWMVFSNLYSIYVEHFPRYANIYGSVYAVAVTMLWLYFCLSILFYGGALNRLLLRKDEENEG